ncbi:MAG: hypothetical protein ACNA7G_05255 [Methylobacter sp.]
MKFPVNALILVSNLCFSSLAWADTVAVKDGAIFLIGGPVLSVQSLPGAVQSTACLNQLATQLINPAATDVVISGRHAVVAPGLSAGADVVNISACLSVDDSDDSRRHPEDEAKADLGKGTLTIPCLNINDTFYNVMMHQRGNSMNWEVVFGEPVINGSCY